mmetsp:Transcript_8199/g.12341  ORF Transcript_8199/g.12341 Transcript_8199/m.12341 type:complete len:339 (-) Transcript_8199:400-1416(-)
MCISNDYTCDFLPPFVAFSIAGGLLLIQIVSICLEKETKWSVLCQTTIGQMLEEPSIHYLAFLSFQVMLPALYIACLQYNFMMTVYIMVPVSLILALPQWGHNLRFKAMDPFSKTNEKKDGKDGFEVNPDEKIATEIERKKHSLKFKPRTVYLDFGIPIYHVVIVFILQILLLAIYGAGVLEPGRPRFDKVRTYFMFWIGAISKGIYYMLYRVYVNSDSYENDEDIWQQTLFLGRGAKHQFILPKEREKRKYKITTFEWHLRHAMSYFINAFGYMYIFHFLLFISLGNSPLQDFVLNFVEVKFVFEIDNYSTWGLDKEVEIQVLKEGQIPKSGMSEDV